MTGRSSWGELEERIRDVAARIAIVTSHWIALITEFAVEAGGALPAAGPPHIGCRGGVG